MKLRALVFAALLLCPALSWGQVAYDSSCNAGASSAASVACNLTVSGSNRLAHVGVSYRINGSGGVSGATYNSVATTAVSGGEATTGGSLAYVAHTRYLVAPDTGTNSCSVSFTGTYFEQGIVCTSFTGVDQTTPLGTPATATATSSTPSVTVSGATADDFVIDQLTIVHSATLTVGASQTQRANTTTSGWIKRAASTQDGTDGGVMSWTNGDSQAWAQVGNLILAAGGAPATATPQRMLLGVGQ